MIKLMLLIYFISLTISQDICPFGKSCTYSQSFGNCLNGLDCTFICSADNSCYDGIVYCGTGQCKVVCSGNSSCDSTIIYCTNNKCDVQCSGDSSCMGIIVSEQNCDFDLQCTGIDACLYRAICEPQLYCNP